MKSVSTLLTLANFIALATAACTRMGYVHLTFYGYPDNNPPSADTAYNCGGRDSTAGGTGTYIDPVTFGGAEGEFNECEVVYVPYLKKYARYEDYCAQCTLEFASNIRHMNVWAGSSVASLNGGADQIACEASLAPNYTVTIIRRPDSTYLVDTTPFYQREGTGTATSTPVSAPSQSTPASGPSSGGGNSTTFIVKLTMNISVTLNNNKKGRRKARTNEESLLRRHAGSCSGNLYPENDATKICTT